MSVDRPNILIVVLDSARPAWLSCYDTREGVTPNIDGIASDGIVFEKAIGPSAWTFPAMASVLTGMLPTKHGGHDEHRVLDSHYPTMAEIFERNGYDTAAVCDVPYVGPLTQLDRGFRMMTNLGRNEVSAWHMILKAIGRAHRVLSRKYQKTNETRVVMGEAMRWLDRGRDPDKPFLLYVHSDEPHAPLLPPPYYRRRFTGLSARQMRAINQDKQLYVGGAVHMTEEDLLNLRNLARAETAFFDEWIGRLMRGMDRIGVLENTVVVIMADHGDNFGEHGLIRHGLCLYDTLVHVPFVIRVPGGHRGKRVEPMVRLIDLLPTLMSLASIDDPCALGDMQGQDLLAMMDSGEYPEYAVSELYRPTTGLFEHKVPEFMPEFRAKYDRVIRSYRTPTHKYIWSSNGRHELYDLASDPGEEQNLIDTETALAQDMQTKLDEWLASFAHAHAEQPVLEEEVDDERVLQRLRDLGYME